MIRANIRDMVAIRLPPNYSGETMKTIATIAASVVLSLGMLAAPATAVDKEPSGSNPAESLTDCERLALGFQKLSAKVAQSEATIVDLNARNTALEEDNTRLVTKVSRKDARIELLKKKLDQARNN